MKRFPYPNKKSEFVIYGRDSCPFCVEAKKYLKSKNKKFLYYNIEQLIKKKIIENYGEYQDKLKSRIGNYFYIPVIFHYGKFIGGFSELKKLKLK